ncbi:MAG: FAD-dependent oxidoreductase, partial [Lachnospiraceae bacterium]|nr:FAD-dependent oxidoreductase [Lachnospiraceae bacterium]
NTAVKDKSGMIAYIKRVFAEHGAPREILYLDKPHIGTDELRHVIVSIRKDIERLGGKVYFDTYMKDIVVENGRVVSVKTVRTDKSEECEYACDSLVLATGHSARSTYEYLKDILDMQAKDFAIGLRVQHPQKFIDNAQYGEAAKLLPPADYKLRYHTKNNRAVYSFCMCPGGYVVNASSELGYTVVNGMSNHKRDSENANSAIVVNVTKDDFDSSDVLAGVNFQRKWEKKAYEEAHGSIPVQLLGDYKKNIPSEHTNKIGIVAKGTHSFANLRNTLPEFVNEAIMEAMDYFDGVMEGYADDDVVLCGVETRTSSPVRILRDDSFQSNVRGVYPCGEGAGYAGGIMSAAVDGIKVAHAILQTRSRFYKRKVL